MRRRTSSRSSALLLAVAVVALACRAGPAPVRSLDPNADVVVPYAVAGGGEVRLTVHPRYVTGQPILVALDLTAGTVSVRGPISGRVIASGLDRERVVRVFAPADLAAAELGPGQKRRVELVWDFRDASGAFVAAETYSLSLDFLVDGDPVRVGSVIEVRAP